MDDFDLYQVVDTEGVNKKFYVTGRWEEDRKDEECRSRFVLRQYKKGNPRDDIFAVATTGLTSRGS